MNTPTTIKRSPIVFIRMVIVAELAAFILYSLVASLADYGPIYNSLFLVKLVSYNTAHFLFTMGVAGALTIYVFASWFLDRYTITAREIIHEYGVLVKRKRGFPLDTPFSVSYKIGPVGRLFHYGTVQIESRESSRVFLLEDISYPVEVVNALPRADARIFESVPARNKIRIEELLDQAEHERLEFKSSLRWDFLAEKQSKDIEKSAIKTVAAFLNSGGGYLVLGVDDKRVPVGLAHDYETLKKPGADGFENHFTQLFNSMIGPEFRHCVKLSFHNVNGKELCAVEVMPGAKPAYVKTDNQEFFFIRTGNVTTPLTLSAAGRYTKSRWSEI